jgi:sugar transferase (PEP-CTERM/EpsH1 system associated)
MEHGVVKVVNGLDRTHVASAICSTVPADARMRDLVDPDVPVFQLRRRGGTDFRVVRDIYQVLRRTRPHVLHTHAWGTLLEGLVAGRLARVPFIVHGEHGTLQLSRRQVTAQRWGWTRVDELLSVSSRLAERMARDVGFPIDRIRVIRNGVSLDRFSTDRRAQARAALNVPDDAVVIGAVGRLVDVKDHAGLIDSMALLRSRGRRVLAVIAGDGPLRPALEERIQRQGVEGLVRLLGHREDVESVFAAMDLFVQPSRSEGMSNTVLEAMASGLPVVATRVGGADEMIIDGVSGLLVAPADVPALAGALERVIADQALRAAMGTEGRNRAHAEFSLRQMVANYQALYCALVEGRAGRRSRYPGGAPLAARA